MLEIGSLVDGKYRVLRVVGKGGMSVVYQAVNEKANKIWAIKEVRKDGVQNYEVVKQNLVVETELLKRLNHPNLPSIIDVIDGDGSFLIVMDYIEGNSLSKALETSGAQSQDDVIEWSKQLCDVLGYLHSRNPKIIYRDMKPANVMLKPDGKVSLIDFGTAREFKSSSVEDTTCLGTQGYAAPEQYGGHGQTDERTDIYCLGATMYHLVTGHNPSLPPYEMYPIRQWNPLLSSGLEKIIIKCTQRNPLDRYQNCAELLYALDHYKEEDYEATRTRKMKWKSFLASSIATAVALVGTVGFSIASAGVVSGAYSSLISQADSLYSADVGLKPTDSSYQEAADLYKKAIKMEPNQIEAYIHLLNLYDSDTKLSSAEFTDIQSLMMSNEKSLIQNDKTRFYDEFAIKVADDCFFSFEGRTNVNDTNGRSYSAKWYERVMNYEDSKFVSKAKVLYFLAANENKLQIGEMADNGDTTFSVFDYWENLEHLIAPDMLQTSNLKVQLTANRFAIKTIADNASTWKRHNITAERYFDAIDRIRKNVTAIEQDTDYVNKPNEQLTELVNDIKKHLENAEVDNFASGSKLNQ